MTSDDAGEMDACTKWSAGPLSLSRRMPLGTTWPPARRSPASGKQLIVRRGPDTILTAQQQILCQGQPRRLAAAQRRAQSHPCRHSRCRPRPSTFSPPFLEIIYVHSPDGSRESSAMRDDHSVEEKPKNSRLTRHASSFQITVRAAWIFST
ncbi:hypothetical protein FA95DRAFT_1551981 [Auriscalpium vulgare]|uniref:Uncharacterized protein n=1 Tax=Auriscalpium vulgare TaxID=40419 RepID=A0ACB8SD35_9AGAM|nr:hypothetical protein FA95DRAFT_1551981 [Auriscalpium vulgare]